MKTIYPDSLSHRDRHQLLLAGVAPRPIAFVATLHSDGKPNLAPFSFFGAYSSKPPTVAIGPAIGGKSGIAKDTWLNLKASGECTISAVSYAMVHKANIASAPYPPNVSEFTKAGFTQGKSLLVAPPYVAESPYAMECKLVESIEIRRDIGGNGNLLLLEVVAFHVAESVWTEDGTIDPLKMDLVGRMGLSWYTRTRDAFWAVQPNHLPIGMDGLPDHIRHSSVLTGNDLAKLAYVQVLPSLDPSFTQFNPNEQADSVEIELSAGRPKAALYALMKSSEKADVVTRHRIAQAFIAKDMIEEAWQTLLLV